MDRNDYINATVADLGKPAFWGFMEEDECDVRVNYSPAAPRHTGEYSVAYYSAEQVRALLAAQAPSIDDLCARIKAADDAAADIDYMLDSDDCISVLRGTWGGPLAMEFPAAPST